MFVIIFNFNPFNVLIIKSLDRHMEHIYNSCLNILCLMIPISSGSLLTTVLRVMYHNTLLPKTILFWDAEWYVFCIVKSQLWLCSFRVC